MSEWQPISTAPDKLVLLYFPEMPAWGGPHKHIDEWIAIGRVRDVVSGLHRQPTHWMPLPSPPTRRPEEGGSDERF